jgi:hypothetical protein
MIDPTIPVKQPPAQGEHRRTLIGVGALMPFSNQVSPGRMQMLTNSHLAQRLTTSCTSFRRNCHCSFSADCFNEKPSRCH